VADTSGGDRDAHLTGAGLGQVELGEAQALARGGQDGGADHGAPPGRGCRAYGRPSRVGRPDPSRPTEGAP
jgi:hypothetical protein